MKEYYLDFTGCYDYEIQENTDNKVVFLLRRAVFWLSKSADQGNVNAQCYLGSIYSSEEYKTDYIQAITFYKAAADKGFDKAQYELGNMYQLGQGVAQNHKTAIQWYLKAAEQNNPDAQHTLGCMFFFSEDQDRDKKMGLFWLYKAAENNHVNALLTLGMMFHFGGGGVEQNNKKAIEYYRNCANQGSRRAKTLLRIVLKKQNQVVNS